jgi:hypothetical protein
MERKNTEIKVNREEAASEAIGFILIFSLVMVGIGLITLYGYPLLLEQQSNANVKNMERDMIVLQNDMKSLVYKNVPYKETSLQVSGGALQALNYTMTNSIFTITSTDGSTQTNLTSNGLDSIKCGQLLYESDQGEAIIALENGAVLTRMEFQQGSAMLSEPRWFVDDVVKGGITDRTFIITLVNLTTDEVMSRNGIGTVKMKLDTGSSIYYQSEYIPSPGMTVTIGYTGDPPKLDFTKAWENYLTKAPLGMIGPNPYTLSDVNILVVKMYTIKIESL